MFEIKIKNTMFLSLVGKDYLKLSEFKSGDILNRVQRDSEYLAGGITILPTLVSMVVKIVLSIAILLGLEPIFTLILLLIGAICIVASLLFRRYFKKLHRMTRESDSRVMSFFNEGFKNIIALKVFSSKQKLSDESLSLTNKYKNAILKQRNVSSVVVSAFSLGFMGLYLATLVWGSVGLIKNDGSMSIGLMLTMIQLINILQSPFANITGLVSVYYEMLASVDRLMELECLPSDSVLEEISPRVYNDIECFCGENLTFDYGRECVFLDASFTIKKGDICLIQGQSGIGKSTLFKLMLGVINNYSGSLYFKKGDEKVLINSQTRSLFSYVPQGNMLFSGSIKDNICMLCPDATSQEIDNILDICVLDFVRNFKDGINTKLGEGGVGLSEGQAQRIAIARAVLSKRPILLLDEATSALDSETEEKLLLNLKNSKNDMTIIMISHRPQIKGMASSNLTIKDNKIFSL